MAAHKEQLQSILSAFELLVKQASTLVKASHISTDRLVTWQAAGAVIPNSRPFGVNNPNTTDKYIRTFQGVLAYLIVSTTPGVTPILELDDTASSDNIFCQIRASLNKLRGLKAEAALKNELLYLVHLLVQDSSRGGDLSPHLVRGLAAAWGLDRDGNLTDANLYGGRIAGVLYISRLLTYLYYRTK